MQVKAAIPTDTQAPVAILGCGLIGISWTALFLHHGIDVHAWDPNPDVRNALAERVKPPMAQLLQMAAPARMLGHLSLFPEMPFWTFQCFHDTNRFSLTIDPYGRFVCTS